MHGYCNIIGSIQCYRLVDVRSFWAKMCKIHYFFYFPWTNVIALKLYPDQWVYNTIYIQKCYNNYTYLHSLDYLLYTPFYFNNKFLFFCYYYFHLVSFSSKISKEYYMAFSPLSLSLKRILSRLSPLRRCCWPTAASSSSLGPAFSMGIWWFVWIWWVCIAFCWDSREDRERREQNWWEKWKRRKKIHSYSNHIYLYNYCSKNVIVQCYKFTYASSFLAKIYKFNIH